jgi:hypothetical protein
LEQFLNRGGQLDAFLRDAGKVGQRVGDSRVLQEVGEQAVVDQGNGSDRVADGLFNKVGRLQLLANGGERIVKRGQLVGPLGLFPSILERVEDVLVILPCLDAWRGDNDL